MFLVENVDDDGRLPAGVLSRRERDRAVLARELPDRRRRRPREAVGGRGCVTAIVSATLCAGARGSMFCTPMPEGCTAIIAPFHA